MESENYRNPGEPIPSQQATDQVPQQLEPQALGADRLAGAAIPPSAPPAAGAPVAQASPNQEVIKIEELAERHKRREEELDRAGATVQPVLDELKKAGVDASHEVRHGNAADLLCQIAKEKDATQIIIGRTGDSELAQRLLGGLVITLAQIAPVPVTIVP